jgi:RNA polymerase sigma-70 factor (ECF subfamily)
METFESYRPMMFAIAYRMLGSAMEAEDIVQETYLRYQSTPPENIRSLKAFLGTVVTRLCLDQMKSAGSQREEYVGPWLPEPLLMTEANKVFDYESISMAFLLILENLSPVERAVFLLREVFDYDYAEIGAMLGKDETACRQLFSRAKKHISEQRPRFKTTPEAHQQMLMRFLQAIQVGEIDGLMSLLAEGVTTWSDGGGKVNTALRPIYGRDKVARYFLGATKKLPASLTFELKEVNGKIALVSKYKDGSVQSVLTIESDGQLIHNIRIILNPDKLKRL